MREKRYRMAVETEVQTELTPSPPLLQVQELNLRFPQFLQGLKETELEVIKDFTLSLKKGEIMGVVGASGSGKSLLADAILGILPPNARAEGELWYDGEKLTPTRQKQLRGREIFLIPQSIKSLDPLMKVRKQIKGVPTKIPLQEEDLTALFQQLALSPEVLNLYPFELSGGMARRVLVAMAMVSEAHLIIADEPTPGLDPETRNQVLKALKKLATADQKAVLLITHDIGAALKIAHRIAVFKAGQVVEIAKAHQFRGNGESLKQPYTRALWRALPENGFHLPGSDTPL